MPQKYCTHYRLALIVLLKVQSLKSLPALLVVVVTSHVAVVFVVATDSAAEGVLYVAAATQVV